MPAENPSLIMATQEMLVGKKKKCSWDEEPAALKVMEMTSLLPWRDLQLKISDTNTDKNRQAIQIMHQELGAIK